MDTVYKIAMYASFVIAGIIVALNMIAPLTKSDVDNKILAGLRWFQDTVFKLILPQHTVTVTPPVDPAAK